jgi:hypothetical protein
MVFAQTLVVVKPTEWRPETILAEIAKPPPPIPHHNNVGTYGHASNNRNKFRPMACPPNEAQILNPSLVHQPPLYL